jgi:hypothetical protein
MRQRLTSDLVRPGRTTRRRAPVSLHYNFARPHKTLANPYPRTPAMSAGVADHVWSLREIAALLD